MLFTSQIFFLLLALTFFVYYTPFFKRFQIHILVLSSLIFYSYFRPVLLFLLIFSIFLNALGSYYVYYGKAGNKKVILAACVTSNLLLLAFFKYSPLLATTFFDTQESIGSFLLTIPLPIGISFFTFEGITLLVDAFRNKDPEYSKKYNVQASKSLTKHFLDVTLFVSFFPHLTSGPILKSYQFFPQINAKSLKSIDWERCAKLLITGYFLKMVIADHIKEQTIYIAYPHFLNLPSWVLITLIFGFSMQIFADFAGYSLIALGLAALFGYHLNANFCFPYIARSFSEFWQRWHISLSTFLKEYLYFPLGGNRKGKIRTYLNLLIVMVLGGLWHGAAWGYAIWGLFHGVALVIERILWDLGLKSKPTMLYSAFKIILVFVLVTFSRLFFRLINIDHVVQYLHSISSNFPIQLNYYWHRLIIYIVIYSIPIVFYHLYYLYKTNTKENIFARFEYLAYGIMLFMIFTNNGVAGDFIYFQF
jgi:alginate O-acetyltransferase complex protein AlgI